MRHTTQTFSGYWEQWLHRRRPYLEPGTWSGDEITGRKRLLPALAQKPLGELSVDAIREFLAELADEVEADERAAKTVNNATAGWRRLPLSISLRSVRLTRPARSPARRRRVSDGNRGKPAGRSPLIKIH